MIKLVSSSDFNWQEIPTSLMKVASKGLDHGWAEKRAAVLSQELADLRPEPGKTLVHVLAVGDTEKTGCFAAGAPVMMADGSTVPIEWVAVGDAVLTGYGRVGTVTSLFSRTAATMVSAEVEGVHEPVLMSDNHPVLRAVPGSFACARFHARRCKPGLCGTGELCLRGQKCPERFRDFTDVQHEFVRADELTDDDYVVFHLPEELPPREVSEDEARLMGYWLAEGSISYYEPKKAGAVVAAPHPTGLQFTFNRTEEHTYAADVVEIATRMGYAARLRVSSLDNTTNVAVTGCRHMAQEWQQWFGCGASAKRVPNWCCNLPPAAITQLIYGYMCGDGSVAISHKESRAYAATVSLSLAYGIQRLLWSLGVSAVVCESKTAQANSVNKVIKPLGKAVRATQRVYHVSYALEKAEGLLRFGAPARQGTKVRNFVVGRVVYLAVRSVKTATTPTQVFNLEVEDDHTYVAYNFSSHNCNRNGDGFSGHWNAKNHDHFTKRAHVFQNHKNHDPKLAVGSVKLSAYNPEMGRIELVLALDNVKCAESVDRLEKGDDICVSMGCRVNEDVCSICGHRAKNPSVYCDHAKYAMTKILDDGRQVYVDNPDPGYFDISLVPRPAERTAYSFRKVAGVTQDQPVSSTVLFKQAGLWVPGYMLDAQDERVQHKRAILGKLAEMEKEIETKLTPVDESLAKTFEQEPQLSKQDAPRLQKAGLDGVLSQLAEAKVTLPLQDFLRLIARDNPAAAESLAPEAEQALPGVFSRMHEEGHDCDDSTFDGCPMSLPGGIQEILEPLINAFGAGQPLGRRVTIAVIRGKHAPGMAKRASAVSPAAEGVARLYARYKLAVLSHPQNRQDEVLTRLAVLQNYTRA